MKRVTAHSHLENLHKHLTIYTLKKSIKSFASHKAPGPDKITPIMLKHLPDNILSHIIAIMKASVELAHTPMPWKTGNITYIRKGGNRIWSEASSYRPITLTSFLFKALERMNMWKLETAGQANMHPNQHAFRMGRSCDSAITHAVNYIEHGLENGEKVLGVFLDIKGAFNNIKTNPAIKCLTQQGIPSWIPK